MAKPKKIFASAILSDVRYMFMPLTYDVATEELDAAVKTKRKYESWNALSSDEIPTNWYFERKYPQKRRELPDVCLVKDGYLLISQRVADVISQFTLGKTRLHRISICDEDKTTFHSNNHYILNIAEQRDCLVPEQSIYGHCTSGNYYFTFADTITLRDENIDEIDLWSDPLTRNAFFLSERLVKAMKAEKIGRFGFKPVTILNGVQTSASE